MILHRQSRDEVRCAEKYGEAWTKYIEEVPNVFVPDARFFSDIKAYLLNENKEGKKKAE